MKKLALLAMLFAGCADQKTLITKSDSGVVLKTRGHDVDIAVVEYDECEYIVVGSGRDASLTHKGNCKFCKERATTILR